MNDCEKGVVVLHLEVLAEESSLREVLLNLLPKILPQDVEFNVHSFQGKKNLLKQLPNRLKGYSEWIPEDWRIVVLIDEDRQDCHELKQNLENIAEQAGFLTRSSCDKWQNVQVLNRIIVEELEAWFFGDVDAICQAYPKVSANLANNKKYRDPDAIKGGTWEALEGVLKRAGYYQGGLEKIKVAREISYFMNPDINRSPSFQVFYKGLLNICAGNFDCL
jgi:hypothetical protein